MTSKVKRAAREMRDHLGGKTEGYRVTTYVVSGVKVKSVTTLTDMISRLPPQDRRKVKARAKQLIAEELALRDLRKTRQESPRRQAISKQAISKQRAA